MTGFRAHNNMGVDNLFRLSILCVDSKTCLRKKRKKLTRAEHVDEVVHVCRASRHSSLDVEKFVFRFDVTAPHLSSQAIMLGVVSFLLSLVVFVFVKKS